MGTHPIFESDFDCLTDSSRPLSEYSMNRLSKRLCNPVLINSGINSFINRSLSTSDNLSAKSVTSSAYKRHGSQKKTNKINAGPLYGDGEKVKRGQIIWCQNAIRAYSWGCLPGANVEVQYTKGAFPQLHDRGLFASCDGTVRYTRELYVPPPDTIEALKIPKMPVGSFLYKLHCHVVPEKQSNNFKMKSFL